MQLEVTHFDQWRKQARALLAAEIPPEDVQWNQAGQDGLFSGQTQDLPEKPVQHCVPKAFIELAAAASCFRGDKKWPLLYRTLWRLTHGEPHLLKIMTDKDIHTLQHMRKQVSRDAHKMKAFVRFRKVAGESNSYVAWHEPVHLVTERTAPFFARRFAAMKWSILTPDCSAHWDGKKLAFSEGMPRNAAPTHDEMEELWKTFYRNIFNPARIKVKMMKSEMPVKYWHTMPETALIPSMLEEADKRVKKMIDDQSSH